MATRRDWIKNALAITAGLPVGASLAHQLMATPVSEAEKKFYTLRVPAAMKIRLGSNENPYGPSEKAKQALTQNIAETNRYPFDTLPEFKALLAAKEGVTADHIAVGAGSADLLS